MRMILQYLWGKGNDLHVSLVAKFSCHRTKNAGADRVTGTCKQDSGIIIEPDRSGIGSFEFLGGPNNNGLEDITFFDLGLRDRLLDADHYDIADSCISTAAAAKNPYTEHLLGTGIVCNI